MNNAFYVEGTLGLPGKIQFELIHLNPVAIGTIQPPTGQSECAIAIGKYAGLYNQGECAIAIGESAGQNSQGMMGIAIGAGAGSDSQADLAIALGVDAGFENQSTSAVAIGTEAGMNSQSQNAIAIGTHAGRVNQGEYTIAMGAYAGQTNQHNRTVVLNATGAPLNTLGTDRTYLAPVRTVPGDSLVQYNSSDYEVTTSNTLNFDLTVNGYVTSWEDYTNPPPPFPQESYDLSIAGFPTTIKWQGGVLAPNGKIYGLPSASTSVLIIDPVANTADTTTITGLPVSTFKWEGGVLAPNGKIYGIPRNNTNVLIIDPVTNTANVTTITGLTGSSKWWGGALALDGKIYGIPLDSTSVLIINPLTNTADVTTIKGLSGGGKWVGGVLGPDGKIYGIPLVSPSVLIIDPSSPVTTVPGITLASANYTNGTKVLNCPGATFLTSLSIGDNILITTASSSYTGYVQSITDNQNVVFLYALGVSLPAGTITGLQKTRKADVTTITGLPGTLICAGGVLGPDGKIYGMPFNGSSVLIIDPSSPVTTVPGITLATANYTNGTKVLNCPGATFLASLTIGDNILITTVSNSYTGYVQSITDNQNVVFLYALGVSLPAGTITGIQKTRKADVTTITGFPLNGAAWIGGVLARDGKIYGIPRNSERVLILDPLNPSPVSSIPGVLPASYNNGTLVLTAAGASFLSSVSVGDNLLFTTTVGNFTGYVQTVNSNTTLTLVYALGVNLSTVQITNIQKTRRADVTTITGLVGLEKWGAGVLAPNSKIYGIPHGSTSVIQIRTGLPKLPEWPLQAYFNKQ